MKKRKISLVKFTVVAAMVGVFSPSVSVKPDVVAVNGVASYPFEINVSLLNTAEARGRRGGGAHRGNHRARSRPAHRPANRPSTRPGNRPPNRNINRKVNRNVTVNVNHRYYGGYGRGYGYYGGYPILAFTTGLAIGSIIASSTMPSMSREPSGFSTIRPLSAVGISRASTGM